VLRVFGRSVTTGPFNHPSAAWPKVKRRSAVTVSPRLRLAFSSVSALRAGLIPPSTLRQRWTPAASRQPISNRPSGRR
jgi:hypothetical protein